MSALLTGRRSSKPCLKSGPAAAILLNVLSRPKPPCMPCPSCKVVSETWTAERGSPGVSSKVLKVTTIDGAGIEPEPSSATPLNGKVPECCRRRIDEQRPDVILAAEKFDDFTRHDTVVAGDVHQSVPPLAATITCASM